MSWNLLALAVPAYGLVKMWANLNPGSYKKFDDMPESDKAVAVVEVVTRVLNAENVRGAEHFERVQDMLKEMPEKAGPKTIESLLRYRLKVIRTETDDYLVFATGTDTKAGKYYIGIGPDPELEKALPWAVTHELSHILNDDQLSLCMVKTISSAAAAVLSVFALRWSLPLSLAAAIITNCVAHTVCSQIVERVADDFAIKHCSKEQLKEAVSFFELIKARRANGFYLNNPITWLLHPSEDSRIAKIQKTFGSSEKMETA